MIVYPNAHFEKVEQITVEFLQKNKIKALILDVDNTLIDYNRKMAESILDWAKEMKKQEHKFYPQILYRQAGLGR